MSPMLLAAAFAAIPAPAAVDALFASVNHADTPGCAVDVRRRGAVVMQRAYGSADLEGGRPITLDTVFEAGSVSKQFIGAGLALLATQGRLSLEDHVRRWLPELPALYEPVTLRMLLNHSSGIGNWDNLAELTGWPEGTRVYDQSWVLAAIARLGHLNFRPGTEYLYSNSNYVLAALVVERASGERLNMFYRHAFFDRLGMARSQWRDDFRRVVPGRAQAYLPADGGGWRLDLPYSDVVGAGGLLTNVGDLQRWNAALADPAQADRAWVALLVAPGHLADGTAIQYGLGLELAPVAGQPAFSHAGSTASYRSWLGRFPDQGLSVALLCNAGSLNTEDLGPELAALFLPTAAPASPAPATAAAVPSGVAGLYRNLDNDAAIVASADGNMIRFNGGGAFALAPDGTLVSADRRRVARLTRGPDGTVTNILLGRVGNAAVRLRRVPNWAPDRGALATLVGRYRSADTDGEQRIELDGNGLRWRDPRGISQPLRPVYPDMFEAPESSWTLRFTRDRRGNPAGFDASLTRIRRVHFSRAGP
jgi:CubicO group peptidase (beta-lactamase class C family)